jgi:Arc/MetJ-type ribon-helix-helix transcriptional regulator
MKDGYRDSYTGFSLKKDFIKSVEEEVKRNKAYCTVTEFIRAAIREKMDRLETKP